MTLAVMPGGFHAGLLKTHEMMRPEDCQTEEAATHFHHQNRATHLPPVHVCERASHSGERFAGPKFSRNLTKPAGSILERTMDFTLDNPIKCTLAGDWYFQLVQANANQTLSHKIVDRHRGNPEKELLESLADLEAELYRIVPEPNAGALDCFWSSFEVHHHLTVQAVKLRQFGSESAGAVADALATVRAHLHNYVRHALTKQSGNHSDQYLISDRPECGAAPGSTPVMESEAREPTAGKIMLPPHRKRGRPTKIPDEVKQKALNVQGEKARAQILYQTKYPTSQQKKNVHAILKHFTRKQQSGREMNKS